MIFRDSYYWTGINRSNILSLEKYGEGENKGKNEISKLSHHFVLGVKPQVHMQNPQTGSRQFSGFIFFGLVLWTQSESF